MNTERILKLADVFESDTDVAGTEAVIAEVFAAYLDVTTDEARTLIVNGMTSGEDPATASARMRAFVAASV